MKRWKWWWLGGCGVGVMRRGLAGEVRKGGGMGRGERGWGEMGRGRGGKGLGGR